MADHPSVTFFYIAEPPDLQFMACTLLASIRTNFPASVRAIGYCPAQKMAELHPAVLKAHALMDAEIRPMETETAWATPYPHGNKIVAAYQRRETDHAVFLDSDILFLRPNEPSALCRDGAVGCSVAASMVWAGQEIWEPIYGAFGMPVPEERVRLMRRGRHPVVPYYSAGLVAFPERDGTGAGRFADVWYETAQVIDRIETLDRRRPYLDQMSLPVAIRRAGLAWNDIPEEQHYIMGGRIRGRPLPTDREIFTVHYRNMDILKEAGLIPQARAMMQKQTGVRHVRRLVPNGETV